MTQHVLGMPWLLGSFNYRPFQMDQGYLEITYSSVERQERSSASLDSNYCGIWVFVLRFSLFFFSFFFFFFCSAHICWLFHGNNVSVHCLQIHKFHFSAIFSLKMGLTVLFTHLKIILLQCFQFQFLVSAKISSIQTYPKSIIRLVKKTMQK